MWVQGWVRMGKQVMEAAQQTLPMLCENEGCFGAVTAELNSFTIGTIWPFKKKFADSHLRRFHSLRKPLALPQSIYPVGATS